MDKLDDLLEQETKEGRKAKKSYYESVDLEINGTIHCSNLNNPFEKQKEDK
jgi:hypothetical protein